LGKVFFISYLRTLSQTRRGGQLLFRNSTADDRGFSLMGNSDRRIFQGLEVCVRKISNDWNFPIATRSTGIAPRVSRGA
jgi:hypothetical protein